MEPCFGLAWNYKRGSKNLGERAGRLGKDGREENFRYRYPQAPSSVGFCRPGRERYGPRLAASLFPFPFLSFFFFFFFLLHPPGLVCTPYLFFYYGVSIFPSRPFFFLFLLLPPFPFFFFFFFFFPGREKTLLGFLVVG